MTLKGGQEATAERRRLSSIIIAANRCAEVTVLWQYSMEAKTQACFANSTTFGAKAGGRELPALMLSNSRLSLSDRVSGNRSNVFSSACKPESSTSKCLTSQCATYTW